MAISGTKFTGRDVGQSTASIPDRPFERANPLVAFIPQMFNGHSRKMPTSRRADKRGR